MNEKRRILISGSGFTDPFSKIVKIEKKLNADEKLNNFRRWYTHLFFIFMLRI